MAHELGLGRVLHWPIVSRTQLADGLSTYDALGRLQDLQITRPRRQSQDTETAGPSEQQPPGDAGLLAHGIGCYLQPGPLGTALLPTARPRVLLVDELDKSDIDLPNEFLSALEEGEFGIPELERIAEHSPSVRIRDTTAAPWRSMKAASAATPSPSSSSPATANATSRYRCCGAASTSTWNPRTGTGSPRWSAPTSARTRPSSTPTSSPGSWTAGLGEQRAADQLLNAVYLSRQAQDEEPGTRAHLAD